MADLNDTTKRCPKCELWLDRGLFGKHIASRDGLISCCKACAKARKQALDAAWREKTVLETDSLKQCFKCEQWLKRELFTRHKAKRDGLSHLCKPCTHAVMATKRDALTDEQKLAKADYSRAWAKNNSEKVKGYLQAYLLQYPEKVRAAGDRWRAANPEQLRLTAKATQAKRRTALGKYTPADLRDILKLQSGKCAYCRKSLKRAYHADHIVPIKLGGTNDRQNIQLTCQRCNLTKQAKHPLDFARQLGRLL